MIHAIETLLFYTDHVDETVDFYRNLGLNLERQQDGRWLADAGSSRFIIQRSTAGAGEAQVPRTGGAIVVAFGVDSLSDTMRRMRDVGAQVLDSPDESANDLRASLMDPDGREVRILERIPAAA